MIRLPLLLLPLFITVVALAQPGRSLQDNASAVEAKPGSPWLGVSRWRANEHQVVLLGVLKDGPAGKAGLMMNDVIVSIASKPVRSLEEFQTVLNGLKINEPTKIEIERNGKRQNVSLNLEPLPEDGGFSLFRRAAESGSAWAMAELGMRYAIMDANTSFVKADPAAGVRWFERANSTGQSVAPLFLGMMYIRGEGVKRDPAKAFELISQARDLKHGDVPYGLAAAASNQLGLMCLTGQGIERDRSMAIRCFQDAANQGSLAAMHRIGFMFEYGIGVAQDDAAAFSWYRRAAKFGYEPAQHSTIWLTIKEAVESGATESAETKPKK